MSSNDLNKYQKLSEIEHVLQRNGMYLGSTTSITAKCFVPDVNGRKMEECELTYSPALLKMFDEIISNSVDEHIRSGNVNQIKVNVNHMTGEITIEDNGGIPVKKHPEYGVYIPTMIFGELRTGSNFSDEERFSAGLNGLGSKLTSIFSKEFHVETCDGKKKLKQTFKNNLSERTEPKVITSNVKGTLVRFVPDYERLGCKLDEDNVKRIEKRVYDVAGCNPLIQVYLNNKLIKVNSFGAYTKLFSDSVIEDNNKHWHIAITPSNDDTFKHISFVNGVDTYNGGTHVDYIANQIVNEVREYIKKKHKVDVKPNNIRQHICLFINAKINAPTFTSQTKEFMSTDIKDFGTEYKVPKLFINKIIRSDIVQRVLDWAESQQRQKELAEMRKLNKQTQNKNTLKRIVKFDDATSKNRKDCILVLTEGDSAAKTILSARDPKKVGVFPLRGKPINVRDISVKKLTSNEEFANILTILGLKLGHEIKKEELRFGKIVIGTDFDPDGAHICGLIINMFQQLFPELIKNGLVYRLKTPLIIATKGKKQYEFFSKSEYTSWKEFTKPHKMKYYKGLGGFVTADFKKFLQDSKYLEPLAYDNEQDFKSIDLAFDRTKSNERKDWLLGTQY